MSQKSLSISHYFSRTPPRQDLRGVRRQDSANTLQRQDSAGSLRPVEREPYVDSASWKDTLRSPSCASHRESPLRASEAQGLKASSSPADSSRKKVELELSDAQVNALKALGMM